MSDSLRDVPDDVVARLGRLAQRQGISLESTGALIATAARMDNARLLAGPPVLDVSTAAILAAVDEGRR